MHLQRKVWRNLFCVAALVTFALPLATPLATTAQAQSVPSALPVGCSPSTATTAASAGSIGNCYVAARLTPPVVIDPIGQPHTVTFICDALTNGLFGAGGTAAAPTVAPGCYDVRATVTDLATGSPATIQSGTCGNAAAAGGGGTSLDCSGVASPICPVGTVPSPAPGPTTPCTAPATPATGYFAENTATVTINPGAPHAYTITFTGYIPTTSLGSCPAGTVQSPGVVLTESFGVPPNSVQTGSTGACQFTVSIDKKYAEITNITLTNFPTGTKCGGSLFFAEGLKSFFGPGCFVVATVTGTVILKFNAPECPAGATTPTGVGTPPNPPFPAGSTYVCVNGALEVSNIPLTGVPLNFIISGTGASFNQQLILNGTVCAGVPGATTGTFTSGVPVLLCPIGPGAGSVQACLAPPLPNNQPSVCSNTLTFTFTQFLRRVVPQVRWAGEKIALTKCFGVGLGGSPIEFTLKGNNPGLNATLLPTDLGSTIGATGQFPIADTIWTVADPNGCATVLGFADGEGVMYVDASIFSTTGAGLEAGSPMVNEHAFEVFYLKFDHLDLENINPAFVYQTAANLPASFVASVPTPFNGATVFPTTFTLPSAPGANSEVAGPTGFAVPLCVIQYVRAMVHGYFEMPGDPSGRPATSVAIPGAPLTSGGTPSAGSYVLPAGRWVLPEDWPVLATFAGFSGGTPFDFTPSSVFAWDLNSGWVFNPAGERPVMCNGGILLSPVEFLGAIPLATVDLGPCFSIDVTGTVYSTAPAGPFCTGGQTIGFSGFDPVQSCTNPFPLAFTPAGASLIGGIPGTPSCPAPLVGPCIVPAGINSTYLPNGTLNQWDAPMPPAQVSFGITSGFGFLNQVSKTGLYQLTFILTPSSSGACPTGYVLVTGVGCVLSIDPNPFYASAIPASPFIPPTTNNGGYLWNSWNFSAGTVTTVATTSPFAGVSPGGFVPGQSTFVTIFNASLPTGTCPTTFFTTAPSTTTCTVPGGINVSTCTATGTSDTVIVADGRGFLPGMTVEKYETIGGLTVASGMTITAVLPSPQAATATTPAFPNAVELVFAPGALAVCTGAATFSEVFIAQQFGLPVPSAATFAAACAAPGTKTITIGTGTASITVPIVLCDTTNNIIYVASTGAIAAFFGPCPGGANPAAPAAVSSGLSRPGGPIGNPFCEPNLLVPAGTLIQAGPVGAVGCTGAGGLAAATFCPVPVPYPFWQWISGPPVAGAPVSTAATVYSDNHGEAVVSLSTGIVLNVAPVAGVCPSPYKPLIFNGVILTCQLPYTVLGPLGLANITAVTTAFSAAKPGCIQTFPSGTTAIVPTPASGIVIGANGPAPGQICINALGGIEFGAGAALGAASIQAIADYPYTREHAAIGSATLTKVFTSAFAKSLSVSAPTPGPAGTVSYTITVTGRDICGTPILEPIFIYALGNAGAVVLSPTPGLGGSILSTSTTSAVVTVSPVTGQTTLSLEVLSTAIGTQGLVVKAVFPFEAIERFVTVIPGSVTGATVNVPYGPGWNQIGGPPNSNFGVAEALFSWDAVAGNYVNASASAGSLSSAAPGCTGYWAYFAAPMVVSLPATSHSGDTAVCTLAAGWNLVGNPFATPAALPSGVQGYHWNGTSYDLVGQIPVGGSLWIFNDGTHNSLTLTAT